ncbi:MAG: PAS domain S-box protein [Thermodesulfobacteriota bacterium]
MTLTQCIDPVQTNRQMERLTWVLLVAWMLLVVLSGVWMGYSCYTEARKIARVEVEAFFARNESFRRWAAGHGGVYVRAGDTIRPNPYLNHIADRDIRTASGDLLTLVNPMYMERQLNEMSAGSLDIRGHLTSLTPMRPENRPDLWESRALFELSRAELPEIAQFTEKEGVAYLRVMRPLRVSGECVDCHGFAGYREGEVCGGASLELNMTRLQHHAAREVEAILLWHAAFLLSGLLLIRFGSTQLQYGNSQKSRILLDLAGSEERYRLLVENTADLVVRVDRDGRFSYVNPVGLRIFGKRPDEILGTPALHFVHPEDRERTERWFQDCIAKKLPQARIENRQVNCLSGEVFHLSWTASFLHAENGALLGMNGIGHDIGESKKAAAEKERLLANLRKATEEIKVLQGILPICSFCKQIRDDKGYWNQLEKYLSEHSEVRFSHSICPDCLREHYPAMTEDGEE